MPMVPLMVLIYEASPHLPMLSASGALSLPCSRMWLNAVAMFVAYLAHCLLQGIVSKLFSYDYSPSREIVGCARECCAACHEHVLQRLCGTGPHCRVRAQAADDLL